MFTIFYFYFVKYEMEFIFVQKRYQIKFFLVIFSTSFIFNQGQYKYLFSFFFIISTFSHLYSNRINTFFINYLSF